MTRRTFPLLLAAASLAASAFAGGPPPPPSGWTDGYVLANGIRIHYWRTGGDKTPLVMAHGSSDNGLCWTALAKELEGRYDVIMYDARGHGLSDPASEGDPADVQAEDMAAFIKALGLEKPIVMGHSMGAASAAWFAAKYPDVPRAVVLEDPGLLPRNWGSRAETSVEERMQAILDRNNTSYDDLVAGCVENSPTWGLEECRVWAPSKQQHHPSNAYRRLGERPAMTDLFARITAPTLILKADAPNDVRAKNKEVAAKLAKGEIVHIDDAGHNVRREQKEALLAALNAFLKKL